MNHLLLSALVLSVLAGCGAAMPTEDSAQQPPDSIATEGEGGKTFPLAGAHIVFYNVENLFDTEYDQTINDRDFTPGSEQQWTPERLDTKLDHLAEAIGFTGKELPVLIGVCEVENKAVVERLANDTKLKPAHYAVVHHDSPDERGIDVGLLFDTDVFQLIRSEPLNVPLENDATRDILHAELSAGGQLFHIFVNHWPSRREGQEKSEPKRMIAAQVLKEAVAAITVNANTHVIIMGDFNDTPEDRSIQSGLGAQCKSVATGLVDLMCVDQPVGHGSHQYNGEWDYLDQFIISAELFGSVKSAKSLWDDRLLFNHPKYGPSPNKTYSGGKYKGGYSDHLPIVLRFN